MSLGANPTCQHRNIDPSIVDGDGIHWSCGVNHESWDPVRS